MGFAAQALSTPPRLCLLTGIRLPSYFLIPFGIAKHPKTGSTWHLPRLSSLASGSDASTTAPPPPGSDSGSTSKQPSRTATGTHYVGSYEALAYISDLAKPAYRKLIPFRWKEDSSLKVSDMVWREDMASFVLEMLRKSITQDLKYLASRPAAYIVACEIHERISAHDQIAAVLWLGPNGDTSTQGPPLDGAANPEEPDPPPYAMDHYKDRLVPCFNLVALLEHTHLRTLRETAPIQYGDKLAVIKAKRPTVKVQLELWKLLGFLAHRTGDAMKNGKGD